MIKRIGIGVAVLAVAIGAAFLVAAAYYAVLYFVDTDNTLRNEYIFGVSLGLLFATGALLIATVLAAMLRQSLSRSTFRWLAWPGLAAGCVFLALYLLSMGIGLLNY